MATKLLPDSINPEFQLFIKKCMSLQYNMAGLIITDNSAFYIYSGFLYSFCFLLSSLLKCLKGNEGGHGDGIIFEDVHQ